MNTEDRKALSTVIPYSEDEEDFVRSTYRILFANLVAMVAFGFISYRWLPATTKMPLCIIVGLIWTACGWFGWRNPIVLVSGLFTLFNGLLFGQLARDHTYVFAASSLLAFLGFGGLTLYVHITRRDFSFLHGFLTASFFIIVGGGCLIPSFGPEGRIFHLLLAMFATFVFLCWVLYDTSQVLEQAESPSIAAFELVIGIVGLRNWIASVLRRS